MAGLLTMLWHHMAVIALPKFSSRLSSGKLGPGDLLVSLTWFSAAGGILSSSGFMVSGMGKAGLTSVSGSGRTADGDVLRRGKQKKCGNGDIQGAERENCSGVAQNINADKKLRRHEKIDTG